MKPLGAPLTEADKNYTKRQEARRKDVERAFGCLQIKWNILRKPSLTPNLGLMSKILRVCCILHNMHVEEKLAECTTSSVSDVVEAEAMASDQEGAGESELELAKPRSMESFANVFRHLKSREMHLELRKHISNHLWNLRHVEADSRFSKTFSQLLASK